MLCPVCNEIHVLTVECPACDGMMMEEAKKNGAYVPYQPMND